MKQSPEAHDTFKQIATALTRLAKTVFEARDVLKKVAAALRAWQ